MTVTRLLRLSTAFLAISCAPLSSGSQEITGLANQADQEKSYGELVEALKRLDVVKAEALLKAGVNPNWKPKDGYPALAFALGRQKNAEYHLAALNLLARHGADVNLAGYQNQTPLIVCARNGWPDVAAALIDRGAKTEVRGEYPHQTPLSAAFEDREMDALPMVRVLLDGGADPNFVCRRGAPPLHVAAYLGKLDVVKALLEAGARLHDVNAETGLSVLHCAAMQDRPENVAVIRFLIERGARGDFRDKLGRSPGTMARAKGFRAATELLAALDPP